MTARCIEKQHLINDIKTDITLQYNCNNESIKNYVNDLFEDFTEVTHMRLLKNNDIEYGALFGGKAFKTFPSYGVPVWEFMDTLKFGNSINVTTDDTTNLWLYRAVINYFIEKGFKLEPVSRGNYAREAHFTFTKGPGVAKTVGNEFEYYFRL